MIMLAKFAGLCAVTRLTIHVGDVIDYNPKTKRAILKESRFLEASPYVSHIWKVDGREYYRNRGGRCEDAPCCGCCNI
jgi:hypothetical protein